MTSGKRRLLAPEVLDQAASYVLEAAEREGVAAALGGGYALQLYGSPRLTGDVDVVASDEISALPRGKALSFGGYKSEVEGVPVDVILRDDDFAPLYEEALAGATVVEGVPLVSPEHLAAMKMVAGRRTDLADLEFLIGDRVIDLPKTRLIVRRHLGPYAVKELDSFVEETRWRKSKEK
jgi:hypothetical protein